MHVLAKSLVLSRTLAIPKSPSLIYNWEKRIRNTIKDGRFKTYLAIFQENVLSFHITMQDLALVQVQESKGHLRQPVDDLLLGEILAFSCMSFDFSVNITAITVNHDYIKELLPVDIRIFISDDISVSDFLEQSHFVLRVFKVFLAHISSLNPLDDIVFAFSFVSCLVDLTKTAATDSLYYLVNVHN